MNLGWSYRISVIAVYLAILFAVGAIFQPWSWLAVGLCLLAPLALNFPLLNFFRRRRGWLFFFQTIPLLWLYFFYCGVGLILGETVHH